MRLLVNHLTRMSSGYICVAGIDVATGRHVRPVLLGRLPKELLRIHGGPFDMAEVVDLGVVQPRPQKPEVEDHQFNRQDAKFEKHCEDDRFWKALEKVAQPRLQDIFGPELQMRGPRACGVDQGKGKASLGVLRPSEQPTLELETGFSGNQVIRMRISDGVLNPSIGLTDIRFYGADHVTPDKKVIARAQERLASGDEVLLSIGLTRALPTSSYGTVHWLQVNNIHFAKKPTWRLT